jgi:hypothetical protein
MNDLRHDPALFCTVSSYTVTDRYGTYSVTDVRSANLDYLSAEMDRLNDESARIAARRRQISEQMAARNG